MKPASKPPTSPVLDYLEQLRKEFAAVKDGAVATYIPELAKANPDWFGICLVTATGAIYEVGDSRQPFTIQSISKPFVYGLALEDNGRTDVLKKVGMEPTGDAFNSISLEPGTGRPRNPMINAVASIATTIAHRRENPRRTRGCGGCWTWFTLYTGSNVLLDEPVYAFRKASIPAIATAPSATCSGQFRHPHQRPDPVGRNYISSNVPPP